VAGVTKEIVIRSDGGEVVARMNLEEGVLHGHCEWYDLGSNLVAYGFFKNGLPFTGTFLNWARYFGALSDENSYDPQTYCKDWATIFEAGFDSELPRYELAVEAYSNGRKIQLPSTQDV
jgi:hypothetical protein